jgi:hypothetical protein
LPLVSSLISSGQTSNAVNSLVGAGNTAISTIGNAATAGEGGVQSATAAGQAGVASALNNTNAAYSPYLAAGSQGVTSLASQLAPGGDLTTQFTAPTAAEAAATPGYQFQLQQGDQAINRAGAAGGSAPASGGTGIALSQYNQGLAATNYNNVYNQGLTTFQTNHANNLAGATTLANVGETALPGYTASNLGGAEYSGTLGETGATTSANLNQTAAQDIASTQLGNGQAKATGSVTQGNIWSNFAGGVGSNAASGLAALAG